jgi:hypothetical protein
VAELELAGVVEDDARVRESEIGWVSELQGVMAVLLEHWIVGGRRRGRLTTAARGCGGAPARNYVWQNRLNYSDSSAFVSAIQPILNQRTSIRTTHWSIGSPSDTTTVQQDQSRFTSHEGEFTITQ